MEHYTKEQRVLIVKTHYRKGEYYGEIVRNLHAIFGRERAPNETTVRRLIKKFEDTGSTGDIKSPRSRSSRSVENIAIVRDSVIASPKKSVRRRSQQMDIKKSSVHRILTKDLHMNAYKIQLTQELKPNDHSERRNFAEWVLGMQQVDENFVSNLMFSDEAHLDLMGGVNKQNWRIWMTENPRGIKETPLHSQ